MTPCPPLPYLEALLTAQLSDGEVAALARHVEGCNTCQQKLDQLNATLAPERWRHLRERRQKRDDPRRDDFIRRLGRAVHPASTPSVLVLAREQSSPAGAPPQGYEILQPLGRGGMGVVYQARHRKLKRIVALKMLLAAKQSAAADLARFRSEAESIARLQHLNIVQIYEVGEGPSGPFLALEFVNGESLAKRLDDNPQPPRDSAKLMETLARAIHHAHLHGVVHRDLKPANILLAEPIVRAPSSAAEDRDVGAEASEDCRPGQTLPSYGLRATDPGLIPKITDFGLAKRLDEEGLTQTGEVLGTPSYMAPEQARTHGQAIGPATDIYALGAVLYQLLTGRPPFQGVTSVDTVMQVLYQDPVPPRHLQPNIPRDLETICLKCLHKEPRHRYGSAADLAEDLRRFQAGEPIQARPVGP